MEKQITKNQNKVFHQLISQLEIEDEKGYRIQLATGYRTNSSTELTEKEAALMIDNLKAERKKTMGKMQGKLIATLKLLGYVTDGYKEDWERIDNFIEGIGTKNPKKRKLWGLHKTELKAVLNQVEVRYKKTIAA